MKRAALLTLFALVAGCGGGDVSTSHDGPATPSTPPGDDDDDDAPPPAGDPAQLSITRFEQQVLAAFDPYEPDEQQATYLGQYGATYTVSNATLTSTDLTWTVDVRNDGADAVSPFSVDFFRNAASAPSGQLGDERQEIASLAAGAVETLTFVIENADPGARTAWAVADTSDAIPETDEGDNVSTPAPVSIVEDEDWFSVYQTTGYAVQATLDSLPADYDLELWFQDGTLLRRSEKTGTQAEQVSVTAGANGTYFLRIYGKAGARSRTPYRLRVTVP